MHWKGFDFVISTNNVCIGIRIISFVEGFKNPVLNYIYSNKM